jgi:hypothetical protein
LYTPHEKKKKKNVDEEKFVSSGESLL